MRMNRSPIDPLFGPLAGFAQADHPCVPNASAGAIPAVVPKVGLTPRTRVRIDNDTAVFLRNLPPHHVIRELLLDIAEKITPIPARKCVAIFGALQKLDMVGKITPVLARKYVDVFGISQEKYSRGIEDSHCMPIAQVFEAELRSIAPPFPALVYIEPETIRFRMSTLPITHRAQFYRIRCPMIIRHVAQYRGRFQTFSRCSSFILHNSTRVLICPGPAQI